MAAGSPCGCIPHPGSQHSPLWCGYHGSVGTGSVLKSSLRRGNGDHRDEFTAMTRVRSASAG
eukprot:1400069-Prorocentrum_lima.AAC.1